MKEATIEKLCEKLVDSYKEKFPHNPSGVLRLHIDRATAKGKSQEDAVVDLCGQAGIEVPEKVTGKLPKSFPEREKKAVEEETFLHKGMTDSEYQACMNGLGLLEGEEIRLQYVCFRHLASPPSLWDGKRRRESKKGLLVFTHDDMIFMQQEGAWSSNYGQALRFPVEQVSGVVSGGTLIKHIRVLVGTSGSSEQHEFINFESTYGEQSIHEVRREIEKLLKGVRQEKKRLAQEALARGTIPAMIFCKFCGTRNKSDRSHCANCGAPLD